jgi:hypothetical protein
MSARQVFISLFCGAVIGPTAAHAHHAFAGFFDMQTTTEISGIVTEMLWRNPHVRFSVRADSGEIWQIETNSVSILQRMDIGAELFGVGDRVRLAGGAARNGSPAMFSNNILLADGRDVVLRPGVAPYWTDSTLGNSDLWLAGGTAGEATLFRVWSTHFTDPSRSLFESDYPLTPAARAARDDFDPVTEQLIEDCAPKGMPWIMSQPYPIELVEGDGVVILKIEEYDTVRTIYLDDESVFARPASRLGNSVGRWVGDALEVVTHGVDWPYFNPTGIPQGSDVEMTEIFKLSADASRLEYELTVVDPATFTEPVHLDKQWVWRPGEQVRPYSCTPLASD